MIESLLKNPPTHLGSSSMPWDEEALALFLGEEGGGGGGGVWTYSSSRAIFSRPTLPIRSMSSISWSCSSLMASSFFHTNKLFAFLNWLEFLMNFSSKRE